MADISTTTRDANNVAHLTSNTIVALKYFDVSSSTFGNPDRNFYGYGHDGVYREAGVGTSSPSTGQAAKATWASEGEHTTATATRGLEDSFPLRVLIILTATEVVILNADDLAVWMRFTKASGSSHSDYYCLGGSTTTFVDCDFDEGVLAVATADSAVAGMVGLVLVDFRRDQMFMSSSSANALLSSKTILDRNAAAVWTASPGSLTGMGLLTSDVNNVSLMTEQNQTYAATSHPNGITLLRFRPGLAAGYTGTKGVLVKTSQAFEKAYSSVAYSATDDLDGDSTTPLFYAANNTEWASDNIRAGDTLYIGTTSYRIASVGVTTLTLSDEIATSVSTGSGSYTIRRRVDKLLLRSSTDLFYADGEGSVVHHQDQTYQSSSNNIDPFGSPSYRASIPSTSTRDLCVRGGNLYVATSAGVYRVTLNDTSTGLPSLLEYSSSSGGGAYFVLAHDLATALAVDTDSGHLLIATHNGSSASEVVELDVDRFHQKVRVTTGTVEVKSLIGYTNPSGPPTTSV